MLLNSLSMTTSLFQYFKKAFIICGTRVSNLYTCFFLGNENCSTVDPHLIVVSEQGAYPHGEILPDSQGLCTHPTVAFPGL